jgi:hypothetical protein
MIQMIVEVLRTLAYLFGIYRPGVTWIETVYLMVIWTAMVMWMLMTFGPLIVMLL